MKKINRLTAREIHDAIYNLDIDGIKTLSSAINEDIYDVLCKRCKDGWDCKWDDLYTRLKKGVDIKVYAHLKKFRAEIKQYWWLLDERPQDLDAARFILDLAFSYGIHSGVDFSYTKERLNKISKESIEGRA